MNLMTAMVMNFMNHFSKIEAKHILSFIQVSNTIMQKSGFPMILEVLQMSDYCIFAFTDHLFHNSYLIVRFSFPCFDRNGTLGTMSYACAKTIAHQFAYKPYFPVNNL